MGLRAKCSRRKGGTELNVSGLVEQVSQRCWDSWKLAGRKAH